MKKIGKKCIKESTCLQADRQCPLSVFHRAPFAAQKHGVKHGGPDVYVPVIEDLGRAPHDP